MMLVFLKMIMAAIWKNASVHILIKSSSVSFHFVNLYYIKKSLDDIAVSENTLNKVLKIYNSQNATLLRAFPDAKVDHWDQNYVNGKYIIGYELDPSLHQKLQSMLPMVRSLLISKKSQKMTC